MTSSAPGLKEQKLASYSVAMLILLSAFLPLAAAKKKGGRPQKEQIPWVGSEVSKGSIPSVLSASCLGIKM